MPLTLPTDDRQAARCPAGFYVVATPIGNLEDITVRAIKILGSVDLIAAEDTRHTARLLAHYHIRTSLVSCHEYNEDRRIAELMDKVRSGLAVALVSDAGTPSVSDPGFRLVRAAVEQGLPVFPIPGASAAITALCVSGLPTDAFVFIGFAPKKRGRRLALLQSLAGESRTLVFYESPRRMTFFLEEIASVMGARSAVLAREMTKLHEEFIRGTLCEIKAVLADRSEIKGECTLLVAGWTGSDAITEDDLFRLLQQALEQPDVHISRLSKDLARQYHLPRQKVYAMALEIQKQSGKKTR